MTESVGSGKCDASKCYAEIIVRDLIDHFRRSDQNSTAELRSCETDFPKPIDYSNHQIQTLHVYKALCDEPSIDFDRFVARLDRQRSVKGGFLTKKRWQYESYLEYIADNQNGDWELGLAKDVVRRMYELERSNNGQLERAMEASMAMLSDARSFNHEQPLLRDRLMNAAMPDYAGIDGFQSGFVLTWDGLDFSRIFLPKLNRRIRDLNCTELDRISLLHRLCATYSLDTGFEVHFRRLENSESRFNTVSLYLGVNLRRPRNFVFSSHGPRIKYNWDLVQFNDVVSETNDYVSAEYGFQFFGDKLSISLGFRPGTSSLGEDEVSLRIGVSDLQRLLPLLWNR